MQEISEYEQHFNNLQMKLRALASTWILAGFAATAVLLKIVGEEAWLFDRIALINVVAIMSVVGLFVLWVLDQMVYQRLLNSCLITDLYREYKNNTVPPLKTMMAYSAKEGMTVWYNLFYFFPMAVFNLFSLIAFILNIYDTKNNEWRFDINSFLSIVFLSLAVGIWAYAMHKKKEIPYIRLAQPFSDKEFRRLIESDEGREKVLTQIINNYRPGA